MHFALCAMLFPSPPPNVHLLPYAPRTMRYAISFPTSHLHSYAPCSLRYAFFPTSALVRLWRIPTSHFRTCPPLEDSHFRLQLLPTSAFKVFLFRHLRHFEFLYLAAAGHGKFGYNFIIFGMLLNRQLVPDMCCNRIQGQLAVIL